MKTSTVGIVSAAILMVVAGVGFGIAQAGETHSIGEPMESQTLEQGTSSSPYLESRPVLGLEEQESSQVAKSPADDVQLNNPIETGSLPAESDADSSNVESMRGYDERE
jgi:hypothetical protein